jgi:predicted AAA+ superfamily ATPase
VASNGPDYRLRLVDLLLDDLLTELPAIMIVGARAAGKTTTIARRAATVVRLNVPAEAASFEADPDAALRGLEEPVLLDEWQAVPGTLGAVRRAVDADPRPSRFLLTGSVRGEIESEAWPATGRIVRIPMYPMTLREQLGDVAGSTLFDKIVTQIEPTVSSETPDLRGYVELALSGGFPQPALQLTGARRRAWFESYVGDLLSHDIEQLTEPKTRRRDPQRLRRYFEAYALNSGGLAEHKKIYDAAQVNKMTAVAYEQLLTQLYVVEQVPAWTSNRLKRLVHSPKRYVIDAALVAGALRLDGNGILRDGDLLGRVLDTFVAAQLRPEVAISECTPRLHHLRSEGGRHEVDLIAELGGDRLIGIEVKANAAPKRSDARHLAWLRDELGERFVGGVLFHTGPRVYRLDERIIAAPISALWG